MFFSDSIALRTHACLRTRDGLIGSGDEVVDCQKSWVHVAKTRGRSRQEQGRNDKYVTTKGRSDRQLHKTHLTSECNSSHTSISDYT